MKSLTFEEWWDQCSPILHRDLSLNEQSQMYADYCVNVVLEAIKERDDALRYLMEQFDGEVWNCPQCGHAEGTADTDSAIWLRDWLKTHNTEGN